MATKAEMIEEIKTIAEALGFSEVQLADTHDDLRKQLAELKQAHDAKLSAEKDASEAEASAAEADKEIAEAAQAVKAEEAEQVEIAGFVVADGKAITTRRGVVGAGEEITPEILNGGAEALQHLLDRELIVAVGA